MVPEEIVYAAGLFPKRILQTRLNDGRSSEYMQANFSALAKGCLDYLICDKHDLHGVILTPVCTASEFVFDAVSNKKLVDFLFMLDVPRKRNEEAITFFSEQLRQLAVSLEKHFNVHLSQDKLRDTIELFNLIRMQLDFLRQCLNKGIIDGSTFYNQAIMAASVDKQDALSRLEGLTAALKHQKEPLHNRKKILLLGSPLQSQDLILEIEKESGRLCLDDTCIAGTYMGTSVSTKGDLFGNLASSYLNSRLCSRMETKMDRINHISNLLNRYKPDGVIYNLAKFRIPDCYDSVMLKEELFNNKISPPFLVIENDNRGEINSTTQIKIETFMQLL
jgi:benzoyl-CoA reductase/2-hydroxyglutaryl-CoA dehydratase subunit BcrC/BadD/HgdB